PSLPRRTRLLLTQSRHDGVRRTSLLSGVKQIVPVYKLGSAPPTNVERGLLTVFYVRPSRRRAIFALFDKGGKFDSPIVHDFDTWRRASDAHGCDRRIDLHVAGLCNFAGDEGECSFAQAQKSGV